MFFKTNYLVLSMLQIGLRNFILTLVVEAKLFFLHYRPAKASTFMSIPLQSSLVGNIAVPRYLIVIFNEIFQKFLDFFNLYGSKVKPNYSPFLYIVLYFFSFIFLFLYIVTIIEQVNLFFLDPIAWLYSHFYPIIYSGFIYILASKLIDWFKPFFIIIINSSFKVACKVFYVKTMVNFNLYIQRLLSLYSSLLILFFFVNSWFLYPLICLTLFVLCWALLLTIIYFLFEDKSKLGKNSGLSRVIVIIFGVLFVICLTFFVIFSSVMLKDIICFILKATGHSTKNSGSEPSQSGNGDGPGGPNRPRKGGPFDINEKEKEKKNKKRKRAKKYNEKNKDRINEYSKQWRANNKDHIKRYLQEWRENNRERVNELNRQAYHKKKAKIRASDRATSQETQNPIIEEQFNHETSTHVKQSNTESSNLNTGPNLNNIDPRLLYETDADTLAPTQEWNLNNSFPNIDKGKGKEKESSPLPNVDKGKGKKKRIS